MNDFRTRFTKWYYRKGYRMLYKHSDNDEGLTAELIFFCPWWVRLLVEFFFSPSVYYREELSSCDGLLAELEHVYLKGE